MANFTPSVTILETDNIKDTDDKIRTIIDEATEHLNSEVGSLHESATIATTKASEANDSAILASQKADEASTILTNIETIVPETDDISTVANNISSVINVSEQIVPNLAEILQADDNATIATQQATISTTKANEASTSEANALTYRNEAETFRNEAESFASGATFEILNTNGDIGFGVGQVPQGSDVYSKTETDTNINTAKSEALAYTDTAKSEALAYTDTAKSEAIQSNYGFKNYIINGGFDVWQRGESFTNTSIGGYTADRWFKSNLTIVNRIQIANSNVKEWGGNKYRASINTSGLTTIKSIFEQRIENPIRFSGKTITVSFYSSIVYTGILSVNLFIYNPTNTTNYLNVDIGQVPSGGIIRTSYTYTIPELDTAILDDSSYLAVRFIADQTTSNLTDFGLAQVQLEEGSVATPFEQRPYGLELSLCQRYYWQIDSNKTFRKRAINYGASAASVYISIQHPVNMRTVPTVTSPLVDITDATPIAPTNVYSIDNTEAMYLVQNVPSGQYVDIRDGKFSAEL